MEDEEEAEEEPPVAAAVAPATEGPADVDEEEGKIMRSRAIDPLPPQKKTSPNCIMKSFQNFAIYLFSKKSKLNPLFI